MEKNIELSLESAAEIYHEESKKFKYDAFISYRHIKPDADIAEKLHSLIENYKVPKEFYVDGKAPNLRVFRDREELATASLNDSLDMALRNSRFLIVICSKRLPLSKWCQAEVETFLKLRGPEYIIPVLVEGETFESFPYALRDLRRDEFDADGNIVQMNFEHLAADLRPDEVKSDNFIGYEEIEDNNPKKLKKLTEESIKILKKSEIYRIMAGFFGCSLGDLMDRAKQRRQRQIIAASTVISLSLLFFGIFMYSAYRNEMIAKREAQQTTSAILLNRALETMERGDKVEGLLISNIAMKDINDDFENYNTLSKHEMRIIRDGLDNDSVHLKTTIDTDNPLAIPGIKPDGSTIAVGIGNTDVGYFNLDNGKLLKKVKSHEQNIKIVNYSHDGKKIVTGGMDRILKVWNEMEDKPLFEREFPGNILLAVFSYDNKGIFVFCYDNSVPKLYFVNSDNGENIKNPVELPRGTSFFNISKKSNIILVNINGAPEKSLLRLNMDTLEEYYYTPQTLSLEGLEGQPTSYKKTYLSDDGEHFYSLVGSNHYMQRVDDGSVVANYKDAVNFDDLSISEDLDKNLMIINTGAQILIYNRTTGEKLRNLYLGNIINEFSYDNGKILAIDKAGDLNYVYNLLGEDEVVLSGIDAPMDNVEAVKIIPETDYAIAFSQVNKKIYIISLNLDMKNKVSGKIISTASNLAYTLYEDNENNLFVLENEEGKVVNNIEKSSILKANDSANLGDFKISDDGKFALGLVQDANTYNFNINLYSLEDKKLISTVPITNYNSKYQFIPNTSDYTISDGNRIMKYSNNNLVDQFNSPHGSITDLVYSDKYIAINFFEGNTAILDRNTKKEVANFGGKTLSLDKDGAVGVYNGSSFIWDKKDLAYSPIDREFSAVSDIHSDVYGYNPNTREIVVMRNVKSEDGKRYGYVVDIDSGIVVKKFTSNTGENSKIYQSPSGEKIYYDYQKYVKTSENTSDFNSAKIYKWTNVYENLKEDEVDKELENYIGDRDLEESEKNELGIKE